MQKLTWRLENPFRLFQNPAHTAAHQAAYISLTTRERGDTPVLSAERRLQAQSGRLGWASNAVKSVCPPAKPVTEGCRTLVFPKSHRVVVSLPPQSAEEGDRDCEWTVTDALQRPIQSAKGPCGKPHTVDIPYPAGGTVSVERDGKPAGKTFIKVEDILVVGLGDSIGSGEGNPDVPVTFDDRKTLSYGKVMLASESWLRWPSTLGGYPRRSGPWQRVFEPAFAKAGAEWLDPRCHRSLYSYQLRAALQLAVENDQRAVTFLGLACTGSDTLEGLFLRAAVRECVEGRPDRLWPQLNLLATLLCNRKTEEQPLDPAIATLISAGIPAAEKPVQRRCAAGQAMRKPDLVLLSLGGNDIGFSEMVADAILHRNSFYRGLAGRFDAVHDATRGAEKLKALPNRYQAVARAFETMFGWQDGDQSRVILTAYPEMGFAADGSTVCKGKTGMDVFPAFSLDEGKAKSIIALGETLNTAMRQSSRKHGWTFAEEHRQTFRGRGLCADRGTSVAADEGFAMPFYRDGKWVPYNPSTYRPYASRTRWVRTPNDAFMTVNYHQQAFGRTQCTALSSLVYNPFQLFLAGTYGGAFHPTAEGHAAIADAVVAKAREVLKRKRIAAT
jgi:lysophospholipase L1-like esterase